MADSPYIIRFLQLGPGNHEFDFRIDDTFFKDREGSIIHQADVSAKAILHKEANAMQLDLEMKGNVTVDCVRCLESFVLPVDVKHTLLIRMVEEASREEDDVDAIQISRSANEIDLQQALYDFLTLAVPYSPVHPDREDGTEGCDPEVMKYLLQRGFIEEHPNGEATGDDRWTVLKKIKFN